ncbi:MAG: response regulator transcription factor [Defluviitaleaceae bacterium]|nr:response regulator transcription factor [Defluviitaleaceae bacterium]
MKEKKTILLAIRKNPYSASTKEVLTQHFYNVLMAGTAKAVTSILDQQHPHLIMVDLNLPGMGGLALIKNLRRSHETHIIALSHSQDEMIMVDALDAGANDVLTMPIGSPEHLARIRAALRYSPTTPGCINGGEFKSQGLYINYSNRTVEVDGKAIHLTPIEFRIVTLLTINPGKVLTHDQIISEIWGPYNSDNLVLRVNMANIRRKIEKNPAAPKYILTEVGVGYRAISE